MPAPKASSTCSSRPGRRAVRCDLVAPGAQAQVSGDFAALDGRGELSLKVADAAAHPPMVVTPAAGPGCAGAIRCAGQRGSEPALDRRLAGPAARGRGKPPSVQARLQVPRMVVLGKGQSADQALQLSRIDTELAGTLDALTFKTARGRGPRQSAVPAAARAARPDATRSGNWRGSIDSLRLQAQDQKLPGPWVAGAEPAA